MNPNLIRGLILSFLVFFIVLFVGSSENKRAEERARKVQEAQMLKMQKEIRWAKAMIKAPICHHAAGYREQAYRILDKYNVTENDMPKSKPVKLTNVSY